VLCYLGHRRSDDIDLFTKDNHAQMAAVARVKNFAKKKIQIEVQENQKEFFHALANCQGHQFTIQIVTDSHLHKITEPKVINNIYLGPLETLYKMKIATLVIRCSEKDLYDVLMLKKKFPDKNIKDWIKWGEEIDGGVSAESLELALTGANLRIDACDFSLGNKKSKEVYKEINLFRKELILELKNYIKNSDDDGLGKLFKILR